MCSSDLLILHTADILGQSVILYAVDIKRQSVILYAVDIFATVFFIKCLTYS